VSDAQPRRHEEGATPGASPAAVARLDRLAAAARADPADEAAAVELWRALLALDHWILIARGDVAHPVPYAAALPQGPTVLAFTTPERARAAGVAMGLPEAEAGRLLATPLPAAVEWAATLQGVGIVAIAIDGVAGASAPLAGLVAMRDRLAAHPG
jgi:hypothetical protein